MGEKNTFLEEKYSAAPSRSSVMLVLAIVIGPLLSVHCYWSTLSPSWPLLSVHCYRSIVIGPPCLQSQPPYLYGETAQTSSSVSTTKFHTRSQEKQLKTSKLREHSSKILYEASLCCSVYKIYY